MFDNAVERNTDMKSMLHMFSLGIVVKNKEVDSDIVEVYPLEQLPMVDGNVQAYMDTIIANIKDREDNEEEVELLETYTISASWLPFGESNRFTSPDLVTGDTVILFRYADNETYYWTKIYTEGTIRELETVTYVYSNTPVPLTPLTPDNTYYVTVSTRDKYIHLHTSTNDGEHTTYDVKIDTEVGRLTIDDGKGNYIHLLSDQDDLEIHINRDINIDIGRDLNLTVGRDINIDVGRDVNTNIGNDAKTNIGNDATLNVGNNSTTTVGNSKTLNVGNSYTVNAPSETHNNSTHVLNSPSILLNGNVHITQNLVVDGSTNVTGPVSSGVSVSAPGCSMGGGTMSASDVNSNNITSSSITTGSITADSCACANY